MNITIAAVIDAPINTAWKMWTESEHIKNWNHASDDWHTTRVENDLREDGRFTMRMEAKDQSMGFDFAGTYNEVLPNERISYTLDDDRKVSISFSVEGDGTKIVETFEPENQNPNEMQKAGWQAILNNFATYAESIHEKK